VVVPRLDQKEVVLKKISLLLALFACLSLATPSWGANCAEQLTRASKPEAVIECLRSLAGEIEGLKESGSTDRRPAVPSGASVLASSLPVGSIVAFYGSEAPSGFLLCDGAAFTKSSAPRLYEWIRTQFPDQIVAGDIAKVPDLRGMFLRGAGRDLGGGQVSEVGSREEQSAGGHTHMYSRVNRVFASHNQGSPPNGWQSVPETGESSVARSGEGGDRGNRFGIKLGVVRVDTSSPSGEGDDLRPVNVTVNFIIKK
jgi:microcystin-dependent protein